MSPIMEALKQFEAAEANLLKLQRLWNELRALLPTAVPLDHSPEYEDRARSFGGVLRALTPIDGWKPDLSPPDLDGLAATRIHLLELDEPLETARFEATLWSEGRQIGEYRFRLDQKRRALIREALLDVMDEFEACLQSIGPFDPELPGWTELKSRPDWQRLCDLADQIEVLLGSSVEKPSGWGYLRRHLRFGMLGDLDDIKKVDWPTVKGGLHKGLYGANEPVPVATADLGELVATKPRGPILTKLDWAKLDAEGFERLIYTLISDQPGYENAAWLTRTNAPDRGRDVSVTRVITDPLSGTRRERVFIQCKHWPSKSVSAIDVGATKDQMALWTTPRADVLIIATTGRFSTDAVQWVEQHNERAAQPRIEMWPESHLERLLAARPALIAEFGLR